MNRRDMLKFVAGVAISPYLQSLKLASLKSVAGKKGINFGTAVGPDIYRNAKYNEFVLHHCSILTPENQLKWRAVVSGKGDYHFHDADRLYGFCNDNKLAMRGHALIFEKSMRDWILASNRPLQNEINQFIRTIVGRYPNILSWDLFNEITDPDGYNGWLRNDSIYQKIGHGYVKNCAQLMHNISPNSEVVVNEWFGPYKNRYFRKRRHAVLKMLEYLRNNDIQVTTLGVQSHLKFAKEEYDQKEWLSFCKECKDLGFDLKISEIDISHGQNAEANRTINQISYDIRTYLEDTLSFANVKDVISWGLIDSYAYSMSDSIWKQLPYGAAPFQSNYELGILGKELYASFENAPQYVDEKNYNKE
ncbi:endo-1,4-beta-xylanase [Aliiglaciecola sp. 2_MG-2023]|uniref:endo-1,4-beta-xylanase n=1 Tax=unclassified Aliiglaciecola TaxID=2593648 RepID=UPI0026E4508C|nr:MULTISPECIES: endo-1,4-beta-xylanase [unclassified Aliiglaciecola]MDO6712209.1 endo-1,4-beta-xylanase [Aliiglaciecola sp. 2_MG-2023]MDO6753553.1 endo-1,4-beta-xylanase [Aliiglaciecola sp. 1_MG-2023]